MCAVAMTAQPSFELLKFMTRSQASKLLSFQCFDILSLPYKDFDSSHLMTFPADSSVIQIKSTKKEL